MLCIAELAKLNSAAILLENHLNMLIWGSRNISYYYQH